jgi:hypothetical protein
VVRDGNLHRLHLRLRHGGTVEDFRRDGVDQELRDCGESETQRLVALLGLAAELVRRLPERALDQNHDLLDHVGELNSIVAVLPCIWST